MSEELLLEDYLQLESGSQLMVYCISDLRKSMCAAVNPSWVTLTGRSDKISYLWHLELLVL